MKVIQFMVCSSFNNICVKGISTVVPSPEFSLLEDPNLYGGDTKKINRLINSSGFLKRRICPTHVQTSDLCLQAAEDIITKLDIDKKEIDALLFISYTPDFLMPATSYILHKKLGLSHNCICMDIPQACSGYIIGLYQASMLLNHGCNKVLLLVGDSFSKYSDMFKAGGAPIFGDAGSATLLERDESAPLVYFNIQSDGKSYDALMCRNGGFRYPVNHNDFYEDGTYKYNASMDGGRIFDFTLREIAPSVNAVLDAAHIEKDTVDYFVFHQANKFIIENIARQLELDTAKIPMETISKYGNQCGASIPSTIADTLQNKVSRAPQQLLLCGFGVGLSWASALLQLGPIYCSPILEYKE